MKSLWYPEQSTWKSQGLLSTLSAVQAWFPIVCITCEKKIHNSKKRNHAILFCTCIRGGYREGGYQAFLVLLEFIAQALTDGCWCAAVNTYEIVLLKERNITLLGPEELVSFPEPVRRVVHFCHMYRGSRWYGHQRAKKFWPYYHGRVKFYDWCISSDVLTDIPQSNFKTTDLNKHSKSRY